MLNIYIKRKQHLPLLMIMVPSCASPASLRIIVPMSSFSIIVPESAPPKVSSCRMKKKKILVILVFKFFKNVLVYSLAPNLKKYENLYKKTPVGPCYHPIVCKTAINSTTYFLGKFCTFIFIQK